MCPWPQNVSVFENSIFLPTPIVWPSLRVTFAFRPQGFPAVSRWKGTEWNVSFTLLNCSLLMLMQCLRVRMSSVKKSNWLFRQSTRESLPTMSMILWRLSFRQGTRLNISFRHVLIEVDELPPVVLCGVGVSSCTQGDIGFKILTPSTHGLLWNQRMPWKTKRIDPLKLSGEVDLFCVIG